MYVISFDRHSGLASQTNKMATGSELRRLRYWGVTLAIDTRNRTDDGMSGELHEMFWLEPHQDPIPDGALHKVSGQRAGCEWNDELR